MSDIHNSIEAMVEDMIRFLKKWGLWNYIRIYACGNAYCSGEDWTGEDYHGAMDVQLIRDVDPTDYVESISGQNGEDAPHLFDMVFEGSLYDVLWDGVLRTNQGQIAEDAWDFILEHSTFLEEFIQYSDLFEDNEALLSRLLFVGEEGSRYTLWDPLKYESFEFFQESEGTGTKEEEELIPAYTLFDTYQDYQRFLDGDDAVLIANPFLLELAKRLVKELAATDLFEEEIQLRDSEVIAQIRREFDTIFRQYGLWYEPYYQYMLVGYISEN